MKVGSFFMLQLTHGSPCLMRIRRGSGRRPKPAAFPLENHQKMVISPTSMDINGGFNGILVADL
jgi:hypothetical protein